MTSFFFYYRLVIFISFLENTIVFETLDFILLFVNIWSNVDQTTDDLAKRAGNVDMIGVIWS